MRYETRPGAAGGPRPGKSDKSHAHCSCIGHLPLSGLLKRAIVYAGLNGAISPRTAHRLIAALGLREA
jgi:hypothetical protein